MYACLKLLLRALNPVSLILEGAKDEARLEMVAVRMRRYRYMSCRRCLIDLSLTRFLCFRGELLVPEGELVSGG